MAIDRPDTPPQYRLTPIAYRCTARTHQRSRLREGSTLTYHRDGWAFCASRLPGGHRWEKTGGIPLHELLITQRRTD